MRSLSTCFLSLEQTGQRWVYQACTLWRGVNSQVLKSSFDKLPELERILRSKPQGTRILIFCTTKRMCDQLAGQISRQFRAGAIHGDKRQTERDYMLHAFKTGQIPILVATDVAARGLDVPNVAAVINYDFPTGAVLHVSAHAFIRIATVTMTCDAARHCMPCSACDRVLVWLTVLCRAEWRCVWACLLCLQAWRTTCIALAARAVLAPREKATHS